MAYINADQKNEEGERNNYLFKTKKTKAERIYAYLIKV